MLRNVTSLTRSGLRDWLIQRLSAIVLAVYTVVIFGFILAHSGTLDFAVWKDLFSSIWMRVFSIICLFSLMAHAWIGIWTVSTDYIKCTCVRVVFQMAAMLVLVAFLIWGIMILWGI